LQASFLRLYFVGNVASEKQQRYSVEEEASDNVANGWSNGADKVEAIPKREVAVIWSN
jgi:hypothetical protein